MSRHPARTPLLVVGAVFAVLGIGWTALNLVIVMARHSASSTSSVAGTVTAVRVAPSSWCGGSVHVVGEDRTDAALSWKDSWSLARPRHNVTLEGTTLVVRMSCPASIGWTPAVTLTLRVPRATSLDLRADDRLSVQGTRGRLKARTDSGSLTVTDVVGDLDLGTDSGAVRASGGSAATVQAHADSGDVRLDLPAVPDAVTVTTDSGTVRVAVPGTVGYRVGIETDSGSRTVRVRQDSASAHRVTAHTDSGDVTVLPR
ncbi:putative adhesin [Motilibacter peucedani]|uniref:Putative adhesin n=1 Tax=Motilibacter peucedani TaxID=598650 RepID=A0A420XMK9_9ACTN|nr:DUF4097 family beta strand repeat-containing protein [Motilibacter peucedani]RKS72512.1 putative adhesin [Motilibacter peucedani]